MIRRCLNYAAVALLATGLCARAFAYDGSADFDNHVEFSVKGQSEALSNFPLLVRISEAGLPGFKYSDAESTELAFVSGSTLLAYDVDTWNESGESLVWVNLPTLPTTGAKVTMYWSLKSGNSAPPNKPQDAWPVYAGVWHFNETITSEDAATTVSKDATANNLVATPTNSTENAATALTEMVSTTGMFGNARVNGSTSAVDVNGANRLVVNDCDALHPSGGAFTFSGWVKFSNYSGYPMIVSKGVTVANSLDGWAIASDRDKNNCDAVRVYGNGAGQYFSSQTISSTNAADYYSPITVVYNGTAVHMYAYYDGAFQHVLNSNYKVAVSNNFNNLAFGGGPGGDKRSMLGSYDEFRLRTNAVSSVHVAAEYANIYQTGFLDASDESFMKAGAVVTGSVTNDYWLVDPTISTVSWLAGGVGEADITLYGGELRSGSTGKAIRCENAVNGATVLTDVTPATLAGLPAGRYNVIFGSATGTVTDERTVEVKVISGMEELFDASVNFNVKGQSSALSNFPLMLRLSETELPGFEYSAAASNELAFVSGGNQLAYEVDTWNTSGESIVWVLLKSLPTGGATVTMYWSPKSGVTSLPAYNPSAVWSSYAGVWHMDDALDSTDNGAAGEVGSVATPRDGEFGGALGATTQGSPLVKVAATDAMNSLTNGTFSVSFWAYLDEDNKTGTVWPVLFTRKNNNSTAGYGVRIISNSGVNPEGTNIRFYYGANSTAANRTGANSAKSLDVGKWQRYDIVYTIEGGSSHVTWYVDGGQYKDDFAISGVPMNGSDQLAIGGWVNVTTEGTVKGAIDEFRMRSGEISSDQSKAEYENAEQSGYLDADSSSFVLAEPVVTDGGAVTNDYWIAEPSVSVTGWTVGEPPTDITIKFGELRSGATPFCQIVDETNGVHVVTSPADILSNTTAEGNYTLVFGGTGSQVKPWTINISVKFKPEDTFNDHVTFVINGIGDTPIENYPLLLRISESQLPGFKYERVGEISTNMAFTDGGGNKLFFDIDEWSDSASGESIVWVNVPQAVNGTTVTFWWNLKEGASAPHNDATVVWSGYAGVWHMQDTTGLDSAGHSTPGTLHDRFDDTSGVFGNAYGRTEHGAWGPIMTVPASDDLNALTNGAFTVSGWVRLNTKDVHWAYLFSRKEIDASPAWGAQFNNNSDYLLVHPAANGSDPYFATGFEADTWAQFAVVYGQDYSEMFVNGASLGQKSAAAPQSWTNDFYIGGMQADDNTSDTPTQRTSTLNGYMDEVRIMSGAITAGRIAAEYRNAMQTSYLDADSSSFIIAGAVVTTEGSEGSVTNDYWTALPSISTHAWNAGDLDPDDIKFDFGKLRSGTIGKALRCEKADGSWSTNVVDGAVLASLDGGTYLIYFGSSDTYCLEEETVSITVTSSEEGGIGELYDDFVEFVVKGQSVEMTNFPVLVRISESEIPGFSYDRAVSSNILAFVSSEGRQLYYDVDTWNTGGESLVWVRLPILPTDGTTVTMYWSPKDAGAALPGYIPHKVWSAYAGVWHMTDGTDSTGNSETADFGANTVNESNGSFGAALRSNVDGEPLLIATTGEAVDALTNGFTATFWTYLDSSAAWTSEQYLFSRREAWNSADGAYGIYLNGRKNAGESADSAPFGLFYGNKQSKDGVNVDGLVLDGWMRHDIIFAADKLYWYRNGQVSEWDISGMLPLINGDLGKFAIGGRVHTGTGSDSSVRGAMDEFRISAGVVAPERIAAEIANAAQTGYLDADTNSFILAKAAVTQGGTVTNDYWTVRPSLTPVSWMAGEITVGDIVFTNGVLRSGTTPSLSIVNRDDASNATNVTSVAELVSALASLDDGYWKVVVESESTLVEPVEIDVNVRFHSSDVFTDHVTFTLNGLGESEFTNYVMLVRLSESQLPGFSYIRAGDGRNIAFTDDDGDKLYFDIDTWDAAGESLVWVKVPVATNGTEVTLHWALKSGATAPVNDSEKVWSDYVGVWHFNETIESGDAGTVSRDATGNGYDAEPKAGENGNLSRMVSVEGAIGSARQIERSVVRKGNRLTLANSDTLELGDTFTVSGWINMQGAPAWTSPDPEANINYIVSRKNNRNDAGGFSAIINRSSKPANHLREALINGAGDRYNIVTGPLSDASTPLTSAGWTFFSFSYSGSTISSYGANSTGAWSASGTKTAATDNGMAITFGQTSDGVTQESSSFWGAFDEFRIRKGADSATLSKAEYDNVTQRSYVGATVEGGSFLVPGLVESDGKKYDYWTTRPSISPSSWGEGASVSPVYSPGTLRSGATSITNWCENLLTGAVTNEVTSAVLSALPIGSYRIWCAKEGDSTVAAVFVDFTVTDSKPYDFKKGGSGRVLLMNNDLGGAETAPVDYQGWYDTDTTNPTFWTFLNETNYTDKFNFKQGSESILSNATGRLWHIVDCWHGNTFPKGDTSATFTPSPATDSQVFLPFSSTSRRINAHNDNLGIQLKEVGQAVMWNTTKAAIYTSCFTNGVGSVYFDAANAWTNGLDAAGYDGYRIAVYAATSANDGEDPPLDEFIRNDDDTFLYDKLDWRKLDLRAFKRDGTADFVAEPVTNELTLAITTPNSVDNFYRVVAQVNTNAYIRFKIQREATVSDKSDIGDGQILIDNILVSPTPVWAELDTYGEYDRRRDGRQVLGVAGAFDVPFPKAGESLVARAKPVYHVESATAYESVDTNALFATATIHYRWRYLNQVVNDWSSAPLQVASGDGFLKTAGPLDLPAEAGDVEYWFESTLNAPCFTYADYSGRSLGVPDEVSERIACTTNRLDLVATLGEGAKLPSAGEDWFVRLRDGSSNYESIRIFTSAQDGSGAATNEMEVVSDGKWRAYVRTPTALSDHLRFRFEGVNLQSGGATEYLHSTNYWKAAENMTSALPANTSAKAAASSGEWSSVLCDATTTRLVFTYDESGDGTISVCRGDYQDFNRWASAATANGLYVGSSVDKNSSSPDTAEYVADIDNWSLSKATDSNWLADFGVDGGEVAAKVYPRDAGFSQWKIGNYWTAYNASWTYPKWVIDYSDDQGFGGDSALQLQGRGNGSLEFVGGGSAVPDGLDTVTFKARVAQFNDFWDFATYDYFVGSSLDDMLRTSLMTNYTFTTFGALSDKGSNQYDGDGSISLVGYYNTEYGAYEMRVSRGGRNGDMIRIGLYKWYMSGGGMACVLLGTNDFNKANVPVDGMDRENGNWGMMRGLFISVQEVDAVGGRKGTLVHAGVSTVDPKESISLDPTVPTSLSGKKFASVVYCDTSATRLTCGTCGVLSRNCPGVFLKPVLVDKPVPYNLSSPRDYGWAVNNPDRFNFYTIKELPLEGTVTRPTLTATSFDARVAKAMDFMNRRWTLPNGRTIRKTNKQGYIWALVGETNIVQNIEVLTREHDSGEDWQPVATNIVSGFKTHIITNVVHSLKKCDVKLKTGGTANDARRDVVVDDVQLFQWNGQTTPKYDDTTSRGMPTNFVYTSSWILQNESDASAKVLRLQPARAGSANNPVSLRSPILKGYGLFHFDWRNADTNNAVFLLQRCTNSLSRMQANLSQYTKYAADNSFWETIETIDFTEPGGDFNKTSGGKTFFYNNRYDGNNASVLRLVAKQSIVTNALAGTVARDDPEYGSIEITNAYAWDLPPYDDNSWSGWNFRTVGWADSVSGRWANINDAMSGLSGILNNTTNAATLADHDIEHYRANIPYIQSPTFHTNCIGSVEFRARLYDRGDLAVYGHPAVVTIYGARAEQIDQETNEPKSWTEVTNIVVNSGVYSLYGAKFSSGAQYCVLRFGVKGVDGVTAAGKPYNNWDPVRVALDDICIVEQPVPSVRFKMVRPFRNAVYLKNKNVVPDIESREEQPMLGESFGFQAELELNDIDDEILTDDPSRPIRVYLKFNTKSSPWGWQNWGDDVTAVELPAVEGTNLIYRSMVDMSETLCPPVFDDDSDSALAGKHYRIVQYHLYATFYDKAGDLHDGDDAHELASGDWTVPSWYNGMTDPNTKGEGFSAYTVLETIAPGRAWINEVNICGKNATASDLDQWVEIAIPTEVDMSGWRLNLYNYNGEFAGRLLEFGKNDATPAKKKTPSGDESHYDFYVVRSPKTTTLSGDEAADAVWSSYSSGTVVSMGALNYKHPFGFELVRPSGAIEHQAVVQGYNARAASGRADGYRYEGTNLVSVLGGRWVWGERDRFGEEIPSVENYTVGVVTNQGAVHEDWYAPMSRTPGRKNEGQYIDPTWYTLPNGGYVWITSRLLGSHVYQNFGGRTDDSIAVTLAQGNSTNIAYYVDRWYKFESDIGDVPAESATLTLTGPFDDQADGRLRYSLDIGNISNSVTIAASAAVADDVAALIPDNPDGEAYGPAIMNWLLKGSDPTTGWFASKAGPLTNAVYRGSGDRHDNLDLVGMYWLDIDPTKPGWEVWGKSGALSTTNRTHTVSGRVHTNQWVSVQLYITNTVDNTVYAPYRLQGLGGERSDEVGASNWTSETFKAQLSIDLLPDAWRTARYFVFDANSFSPATANPPYTAIVEMTDPRAVESPIYRYGWWTKPSSGLFFQYDLDSERVPLGVSTLKAEDYLKF